MSLTGEERRDTSLSEEGFQIEHAIYQAAESA